MINQETQIAFVRGEEWALEAVIRAYSRPLLRYCATILCHTEEAKDVVQETFIKAYEKRKRFDPKTSLNAWLYRIAYTTAVDAVRKRKRKAGLIFIQSTAEDGGRDGISEPLYSILQSLTVMDRALLYGRVLEEKPYKELALHLNASEAVLRKRYERLVCRLALQTELKESYALAFEKERGKEIME
ncbi:MAG: RNA polymerase sigma factor [Clostridiaceae bacterium]